MSGDEGDGRDGNSNAREQDRYLPIANISRIMKKALPGNAKIAKDAKETVQECVSEFISFITSEASDKCQREKRKTINGDDLLWAMTTLGFEEYLEPLKLYLAKFREAEAAVAKQQPSSAGAGAEAKREAAAAAAAAAASSQQHQAAAHHLHAQMQGAMPFPLMPAQFQSLPHGMIPAGFTGLPLPPGMAGLMMPTGSLPKQEPPK
uniref:CCAAT-box binding factor HAP3-like protein n=1 Tax=Volvox carteri TaxID=3067 RepID=A0A0I9QPW0_VOLCA|nr:TPA_inf: CCAAT-box binding factor HAP3-like protein [Volvox carteri]